MTLSSAASSGDQLKTYTELRDDIANRLELCDSDQNYATLARVFADVLDRVAKLETTIKGAKGTALDELAQRRSASGRPDSSNSTGATRKAK